MFRRASVVVLTTLATIVSLLGASPATAAADLITSGTRIIYASPNGHDRSGSAVVTYRLAKPSTVRARITNNDGDLIRVYRLGKLAKGKHVLRWDGIRPGVGLVPDGGYRLTLRAVHGVRKDTVVRGIVVDTQGPAAYASSNRTTVYPTTTLFTDELRFKLSNDQLDPVRETGTVRRPNGSLVRTLARESVPCRENDPEAMAGSCTMMQWDGRDAHGRVLPAGRYVLRVVVSDRAGNTSVSETPLAVSSQPLVEHTTTQSRDASGWPDAGLPCYVAGGPLGCGDFTCSPTSSERFTYGLSFRSACNTTSAARFSAYQRFWMGGFATGHEQFRVTATGGPTVPGADDMAKLNDVTLRGDGSFTTAWTPVTLDAAATRARALWSVSTTDDDSYDVGTLSVEYTYFAPAS